MEKDMLQQALEGLGENLGEIIEGAVNIPAAALGDVEKSCDLPDCSEKGGEGIDRS